MFTQESSEHDITNEKQFIQYIHVHIRQRQNLDIMKKVNEQ